MFFIDTLRFPLPFLFPHSPRHAIHASSYPNPVFHSIYISFHSTHHARVPRRHSLFLRRISPLSRSTVLYTQNSSPFSVLVIIHATHSRQSFVRSCTLSSFSSES